MTRPCGTPVTGGQLPGVGFQQRLEYPFLFSFPIKGSRSARIHMHICLFVTMGIGILAWLVTSGRIEKKSTNSGQATRHGLLIMRSRRTELSDRDIFAILNQKKPGTGIGKNSSRPDLSERMITHHMYSSHTRRPSISVTKIMNTCMIMR